MQGPQGEGVLNAGGKSWETTLEQEEAGSSRLSGISQCICPALSAL